MRYILLVLSWTFVQMVFGQSYTQILQEERDSINTTFADPELSILTDADLEDFKQLPFYEIDSTYAISARFKRVRFKRKFEMKTSTERLPIYKPYGKLIFELNGEEFSLMLYQNMDKRITKEYGVHLFLPFTDLTNGEETYGGGRYLDFKLADLDEPVIDFNRCYNPYCAYNHRYSCPVPPLENHLETKIEAGVKKWHD